MKLIIRFSCYFLFFIAILPCYAASRTVWLDELDISKTDQSAGGARVNQSMWGTPLIIAQDTFLRGVGTHALGMMKIELDGKTDSFQAWVGIDDSAPDLELKRASVEFSVIGDNVELWNSGIMHAGDKARALSVRLQGVRSLMLLVDHADDGTIGDRANWVNARFDVLGEAPVMVSREKEPEYILTPKPSKQPLINAPYLFGAQAGNPVLFKIPVSGEQPLRIEVKRLPKGLSVDKTGRITGIVKEKGKYVVRVTASNKYGSDTHNLTLEIGDRIALTPPMGWSSWNVFGANIDDQKVRAMADAMVNFNLINYGYTYINIDDGWQGKRGGKYNAILPNERFPDMKALVDYVHAKGLKIGIYSSPWVQTYAGYVGGNADTPQGEVTNPSRRYGAYSFSENDVKQWVDWGFDYLKYDWTVNDIPHTSEMADLLKKSGRDIVYSISNAAPFELAGNWSNLTNVWRTTGDIHDSWCSLIGIGLIQNRWQPFAKAGSWNDPDMLVVGKLGWGGAIRQTRLSPNEQYLHLSLWSILAAPLLAGCELSMLDDFTLNLLTNREVIAVNQDPSGIQGYRIYADKAKKIEVWARPLHDGSFAVGLFNLGEDTQKESIDFANLKISGTQSVRNLWKQENIGKFENSFSADVPPHGVVFVKISK